MQICAEEKCTGCGSCAIACPQNCISMGEDDEGFRYPSLQPECCVRCGVCQKVCPVVNTPKKNEGKDAYAVKNRDEDIRLHSSSGGVFTLLAQETILHAGVVCAAKYNAEFAVEHAIASTEDEIVSFTGAKYAQSIPERCFREVESRLKSGQRVMFVGTPCQVAGLKRFLRKEYQNLLLVDMICHGVPSPGVWMKYLRERKQKDSGNSEIRKINQRSKVSGWSKHNYSVEIEYQNGSRYRKHKNEDWYMLGFINNLFLRPSCADCHFKGLDRNSDITLGDYWGVWDQLPEFDDNKGVSLLLIHSDKGHEIWNAVKGKCSYLQVNREQAIAQNKSAVESSVPHRNRDRFFLSVSKQEKAFSDVVRECLFETEQVSLLYQIKAKLKSAFAKKGITE